MANSYKNIVITPNTGSSTDDPKIVFSGANTSTNTDITLRTYPISNGSLSFEGSAGQLFSITNDLTGTIFSVNDISGIPSVEVIDTGLIKLAQYNGNVAIGQSSASYKLDVAGTVNVGSLTASSLNITGTAANTIHYNTGTGTAFISAPSNGTFLYYTTASGFQWTAATGASVGNANVATYETVTNATTGTWYPALYSATSGNLPVNANNALSFNAATGELSLNYTGATKLNWNNNNNYLNWIECGGVPNNNYMRFAVGNTEAFRANLSGGVINVGIGTSSPQSKIDVLSGSSALTKRGGGLTFAYFQNSNAQDGYVEIASPAANNIGLLFSKGSSSGNYGLINYLNSTDVMAFYTAASERMRIDSSGNVGIGTNSPSGKLDVSENNSNGVTVHITNASQTSQYLSLISCGATGFSVSGWDNSSVIEAVAAGVGSGTRSLYLSAYNGPIIFATNTRTERMRIDSSGNTGIGTASPTYKLDVNGTANTGALTVSSLNITGTTANTIHYNTGTGTGFITAPSNGTFLFYTTAGGFQWSAASGASVGTANIATYSTVTNATSGTYYPTFVTTTSGNLQEYSNSAFVFNAATGALTATSLNTLGTSTSTFTDSTNGSSSAQTLKIGNGANWLTFQANSGQGAYNGITTAGDSAIWFSNGGGTGSSTPGNLVIAPWAGFNFGVRLNSAANTVAITGSVTSTANITASSGTITASSFSGAGTGLTGTAASLTAGTSGASWSLGEWDGTTYRSPAFSMGGSGSRTVDLAPNTYNYGLTTEFKNATLYGVTGSYSGLLTYAPWLGTTASTGDPNYQLLFSPSSANATTNPTLRFRAGIDSTWGPWNVILHSNNYTNYIVPSSGGTFSGGVTITGDLSVTGNTTFTGNTSFINVNNLKVSDPIIFLGSNNTTSDIVSLGFIGNYYDGATRRYTGLYRAPSTNNYYLFTNVSDDISSANSIITSATGFTLATLNANVTGNLISATTQFSGPGTGLTGTAASLTVGAATTATNISGGSANQIHYQTGAGTTGFITAPSNGTFLFYTTAGGFQWSAASGAFVGTANVATYETVTNATTGTYYPALYNATSGTLGAYANNALSLNAATGSLYLSGTLYDNQNTSYYLKPSGTSVISTANVSTLRVGGYLVNSKEISTYSATAYSYDGVTLSYNWTKIATLDGNSNIVVEISTKDDINYVRYVSAIASFSTYAASTIHGKLDILNSYDIPVKIGLDNANNIWIQASSAWNSNINWRIKDVIGSPTIYTSGWVQQNTTPTGMVSVSAGYQVNGYMGSISANTPSVNSPNYYGRIQTASDATIGGLLYLNGGGSNQIQYQSSANGPTSFISSPTTSNTFLSWNGSAFVWAAANSSSIASANVSNYQVVTNTTTNAGYYLGLYPSSSTGSQAAYVSGSLQYNPSTGVLSAGSYYQAGSGVSAGYYQDSTNGAYRALNGATPAGYYFQSYNGATTTMYIGLAGTYAGNVGIGTLTPSSALQVSGTVTATSFSGAGTGLTGTAASLTVGAATTATNISGGSANQIHYQTGAGTTGFITAPSNGTFLFYTTAGGFQWSAATGASVGTANVANYEVVTNATTGTYYPALYNNTSGNLPVNANNALVFDAATGALAASSFVSSRGISDTSGTGTQIRITNPGGASNGTNIASVTGAIKIKLPVAGNNSSTMMNMRVVIYDYQGGSSGTSRTLEIGGYNFSSGSWYNYFATQQTMGGSDINVRFGQDATGDCIWIGDTTSTWSYPKVYVTEFQAGQSFNTAAIWGNGWNISWVTSFDTVEVGPIVAGKPLTSQNYTSYALGSGGGTSTGQIISTYATTTSTGGGSIYLNGSNNRIDFNSSGVNAPTYSTTSSGTKIVLYPGVGASTVDFAFGIESSTLWSSVSGSGNQFKWYAGTTNIATLSGTGAFSATSFSGAGTGLTGTASSLTAGVATLANNISGGSANQVHYQTGAGATNFIVAPSVSGTFLTWTNSGFAWAAANSSSIASANVSQYSNVSATSTGTYYPTLVNATSGNLQVNANSALSFNSATGALSATSFTGAGTGLTGTAASLTSGASNNIVGGSANQIAYQTGTGTTGFITAPANGTFLYYTTTGGFQWTVANGASVGTANVATYETVTNATTGIWYPALYSTTSGNLAAYANNQLSFNAANSSLGIGSTQSFAYFHIGTVGASYSTNPTNSLAVFSTSANSYNQILGQNKSNGNQASNDMIVSNDIGSDTSYYGDFGINSSTFVGTGVISEPNGVYLYAASSNLAVGTASATGYLKLGTNLNSHSEADIIINPAGNVGVGNSSPVAKLHVYDTTNPTFVLQDASGTIRLTTSGGVNYIQSGTSLSTSVAPLVFGSINAGNEWMRIDALGNVSIGASSTTYKFNVTGTANTGALTSSSVTTPTVTSAAATALSVDSGTTGALNIGTSASAKTITIGNSTGATAIVANSGTGGMLFNQVASGTFTIQASQAQTSDMTLITNVGLPTTTAGVNNLQIDYYGGQAAIETSAQRVSLYSGNTSGGIWSAFRIVPGWAANTGVIQNGIKFDTIGTVGGGTDNMILANTGWDNIINYNGISLINGTGQINASQLLTGTVPTARLGTGTANSTTYLRGDGTWATVSTSSLVQSSRLAYTATAGQTVFTTPTYVAGASQVRVYINGVRQYSSDYTETSNTSITLGVGCTVGDAVMVEVDGYTSPTVSSITVATQTNVSAGGAGGTYYPMLVNTATGNLASYSISSLSLNSTTGILSATGFSGSGASLTSLTAGNLSGSLPAISGASLTSLTAGNLTGTIPSAVLGNSTLYIGTTAVTLNRTSSGLALTGITSIDGQSVSSNVSNYGVVTNATTGTYYLDMSPAITGNNATFANSALSFNAATGTLSTTTIAPTGSQSTLSTLLPNIVETVNVSATSANTTVILNVASQSVLYYTANAIGNFAINIRGSSGTTLNTMLSTGQAVTVVFMNTNATGNTYYNNSVQVDGTTTGVTTKWQGGTAPTAGNASAIDTYTYTVIKTGSAAFTVLASLTKFA